jgi:hypothetical protein
MIHDIASDLASLTSVNYDSVEVIPTSRAFEIHLSLDISDQVHDFHATRSFADLCTRAVHIAQAHEMNLTESCWDVELRAITLTFKPWLFATPKPLEL